MGKKYRTFRKHRDRKNLLEMRWGIQGLLKNEVPTKEEFIEKSTTYGYFGGENERKTISPVDEALGEYDLIRGEDKSAEKKRGRSN